MLRNFVETNCENVGKGFVDEARRIHKGEAKARGIYGDATPAEAEKLAEDGIEIAAIPWVPHERRIEIYSMADFHTLDDIEVRGKRVLLRADLNVPVKDGRVTDATRIERLAPTIRELADKGARVVVMSHFGRPEKGPDPKLSLKPLVEPLAKAVGRPVAFAEDCVGAPAQRVVDGLKDGDVALLENFAFPSRGRKERSAALLKSLAALGDLYVNDAFSAAHRAHASTEGVAHLLPAAAGRLMQEELEALHAALGAPKRPVAAIVAGAKVSTKLSFSTSC